MIVNLQLVQHSGHICVNIHIHWYVVVESGAYTSKYASCTQMLFCRNFHESVVEYLVGISNIKLTYAGKSDGSSILHLACR